MREGVKIRSKKRGRRREEYYKGKEVERRRVLKRGDKVSKKREGYELPKIEGSSGEKTKSKREESTIK